MRARRAVLALCISASLAGCASTARVNQFRAFAYIGTRSQVAVAKIVDGAAVTNIDADSQRLITARRFATKTTPPSTDLTAEILASNKAVIAHTEALSAFKRHSALLSDYFNALGALAAFDGESGISDSAKSTVTALEGIAPKLKGATIGEASVSDFVGAAVGLAVAHFKARALEQELRRNAGLIERQLDLQRAFLEALNEDMVSDYKTLSEQQLLDGVIRPFATPQTTLGAAWMAERRGTLLVASTKAQPAQEAVALSRKLHVAFIALVEGRMQPEDLALYAADVARLVALAEMIAPAKATGGQQ